MKRILSLMLSALFLLCACSGQDPPAPSENELIVIGISQIGAESDWRVANSESMKAVFTEQNGYRLLFEDARQKQENQFMSIRKFIQQQVDYIVLMPLSETGWDSVLKEAHDAGIPVILVDRYINVSAPDLFAAHVGSDFAREGQLAVEWIEKTFSQTAHVNIIHIQGTIGSTAQIGRTGALETAASAHENWHILAQLDGDFTQAKAYEIMCQYLDTIPDGQQIDVIYCENDNEAFGVIEALEEHGYTCGTDVQIITFDATRKALELCRKGKIALAVECNPLLGPLVEEIIHTIESGNTPAKQHFVDEQCFTADTLTDEFIAQRSY